MTAVSMSPNLVLQFLESLLWAFVWAVLVLSCVEFTCVVALWVRDGRKGRAFGPRQRARGKASIPESG